MNTTEQGFEQVVVVIRQAWETIRASFLPAFQAIQNAMKADPKFRRILRKRNARETKRQSIEARQVARAAVIVNRAPALIHNGKVPR